MLQIHKKKKNSLHTHATRRGERENRRVFREDAKLNHGWWIELRWWTDDSPGTSQNFGFHAKPRASALSHKGIVKIIFRHRKRKYAPVGAKSLITRDSINTVGTAWEF